MADKGAIGDLVVGFDDQFIQLLSSRPCEQPTYAPIDYKTFRPKNGSIGGVISEAGVPIANVVVFLHWRKNMHRIERTFTDADGAFSFSGLDPTAENDYVVVIQDREGGTVYNDAIFALVAPTT